MICMENLIYLKSLKIIGDSVDFENNETLHFTASFSKIVDWQIRIHGLTSGSVKIISGKSNEINLSNSRWDGSSTDLPFLFLMKTVMWNLLLKHMMIL